MIKAFDLDNCFFHVFCLVTNSEKKMLALQSDVSLAPPRNVPLICGCRALNSTPESFEAVQTKLPMGLSRSEYLQG